MPIIAFRASVPATTPAITPFEIRLNPQARAVQKIAIWSPSSNAAINKAGYRLLDYNSMKIIVPDVGSNDNNVITATGESGWAPIPSTALQLEMSDQLIEGPPYRLGFQFYNTDAALILVGGFIVVHEPAVKLEPAMLYEILTAANPRATEFAPKQKTEILAPVKEGKKVDLPDKRKR